MGILNHIGDPRQSKHSTRHSKTRRVAALVNRGFFGNFIKRVVRLGMPIGLFSNLAALIPSSLFVRPPKAFSLEVYSSKI